MVIVRKIVRPILQYICGLVFAWCLYLLFHTVGVICSRWYVKAFFPPIPQSPHAYDDFMGGIGWLTGAFGGIPLGVSLGMFLVDKLFFKSV
jgi:hypothetical protein